MKKIAFTTMIAVCGIAAGLLVQALWSTPAQKHTTTARAQRAAASPGHAAARQPAAHRASRALGALGATLAQTHAQSALAERVDDLEQRLDEKDLAAGGPSELEMDEEARRRAEEQAEQMFQARFQAHDQTEVDPAWAEPTRQSLTLEMMDLGDRLQNQAQIQDMDCRSGSCKATVEFPSYGAAMAGYGPYLNHFYEVNCAITAALEPAEDPDAPYQVELLFHQCS